MARIKWFKVTQPVKGHRTVVVQASSREQAISRAEELHPVYWDEFRVCGGCEIQGVYHPTVEERRQAVATEDPDFQSEVCSWDDELAPGGR